MPVAVSRECASLNTNRFSKIASSKKQKLNNYMEQDDYLEQDDKTPNVPVYNMTGKLLC